MRAGSLVVILSALSLMACGGAKRSTEAVVPRPTTLTGATLAGPKAARVLVADHGMIAMVTREGCVAVMTSAGGGDEMRVRCPKEERLKAWFGKVDPLITAMPTEVIEDEDSRDVSKLPAAEMLNEKGTVLRFVQPKDAARLFAEVRGFALELEASETPTPGPASRGGWQLVRVKGPAHVILGGEPTQGMLEARMSTSGHYLCEFSAQTNEGTVRATKSGFIGQARASRVVDEVLRPFEAAGARDRAQPTTASAVRNGAETKANTASTKEVVQRFGHVQDNLGDACLPELDAIAPIGL